MKYNVQYKFVSTFPKNNKEEKNFIQLFGYETDHYKLLKTLILIQGLFHFQVQPHNPKWRLLPVEFRTSFPLNSTLPSLQKSPLLSSNTNYQTINSIYDIFQTTWGLFR